MSSPSNYRSRRSDCNCLPYSRIVPLQHTKVEHRRNPQFQSQSRSAAELSLVAVYAECSGLIGQGKSLVMLGSMKVNVY